MAEYTTSTGLVVSDRRHSRANEFPQVDPRTHDPNGNPPSTVGPESPAGSVIMPLPDPPLFPGPFHAEAWSGWPGGWETPYYSEGDGPWSGYGYGRQPLVSRTATAMTCVDLNSRQLASFPTYGISGATPFGLPSWSQNPEPSLYGSWSEFMHGVVNALEVRGEAFQFATARFASGWPARFVNLNPDAVSVEWIDGGIEYLVDDIPVDKADICHLKYQSWPGRLHGISPLEWAARSLATSAALERYATNLSTRGGIPWAVLKSKSNIDGRQATDAQDSWVAASARRDGAPAVLGNAFDLDVLSFSPQQMALLELREFDERRICAAFGVPGYLVNVAMADGLTYANASQLFLHHWTATLRPLAQMIAEAWSTWLLPRGQAMEFNPDRYVQPPLAERAQAYATLFGILDPVTGRRAMEVEEIRAAERFSPPPPPVDTAQIQTLVGGRPT